MHVILVTPIGLCPYQWKRIRLGEKKSAEAGGPSMEARGLGTLFRGSAF